MRAWLSSWMRRSTTVQLRRPAHLTFGQRSSGRSLSRTRLLLKRQLWIWPILAVVALAIVGYAINRSIRQTMEATLRSQLETLLNVERSMIEKWFKVQESRAESLAGNRAIRDLVQQFLQAEPELRPKAGQAATPPSQESILELNARLAKELEPAMSSQHFLRFILADKQKRILAATSTELIGQIVPQFDSFLTTTLDSGKPTVSVPFSSVVMLEDSTGAKRSGLPTMFACAPVRDENLQIVAVLGLRIRPEKEFTEILQLGRIGETCETYAINKDGLMVSNSRFDEALILLGLLPDDDQAASILNIQVRDPGGNLVEGFRPGVRRRELPLTEAAARAVAGTNGIDMQGYRDYRGSPSVGAWTWLPEYRLGIITEVDLAEAYRPLTILNRAFYSLFGLLGVSAAAIFVFTIVVARLRRQAQKAEIEAKQLGQYRLQEKIGAGAMGVVYKGQHALLRRPTAVKMLEVEKMNEGTIERFEREVQMTCTLNNPHTVAIYDYGRTPEGVFFYAMEYLDGLDLQSLVEQDGAQPEGRVVHILRQICASLYEAHSLGLVHRDIKPANIMLNRRGAEPDVVKVLDFGLVKGLEDKLDTGNGIAGTPLYMAPEAFQTPEQIDARSDLYAVGAVGYFLLTGEPVFGGRTVTELFQQHVTALPVPPSERLGRTVSPELEHAILACLEKNRAKRPQTARDLSTLLDRVDASWSVDEAEAWWSRYERGQLHSHRSAKGSAPSAPAPANGDYQTMTIAGPSNDGAD